jgi:hypothetical protein
VTPAQFLAIFPEFGNGSIYTSAMITFWLSVSSNLINQQRWGALAAQGQALLTAHYLVLAQEAQQQASMQTLAGGMRTIGGVSGPEVSKAVDGVSVTQDVGAVTIPGAGTYNRTQYGIQYYQFAQMMGAGGMQINAC